MHPCSEPQVPMVALWPGAGGLSRWLADHGVFGLSSTLPDYWEESAVPYLAMHTFT
ncbi:hypothetical protein [Nonomuraea sp. NPDC049158]|uniref:hypothetical protein n=1 Tax=Nonomuraea sp. NPDC049158 TaxID=3155649 RepID=UPI0033C82D03